MSKLRVTASAALLTILLSAGNARAALLLTATLSNAQENPPTTPTTSAGTPRPASFGTATFALNDTQTMLSFSATIFNIDVTGTQTADPNDNLVAAHIHSGSSAPPTNNPVVWGFFGTPFNDTIGPATTVVPFASGVGGTFSGVWDASEGNNTTLTAQLQNILAGRAYINFHTVQFPGGETRGQIIPTPEPGTLLLLATGIGATVRRRLRV